MGIYEGYAERNLLDGGYRPIASNADLEATFGEVRRASAAYQELTGLTTSEGNFYREPLQDSLLKLQQKRREKDPNYMLVPHTRERPSGDPKLRSLTMSQMRELAQQNEGELKDLGAKTLTELDEEYRAEVERAQQGISMAGQRTGTGTMLAGSIAGGAQAEVRDPLTWATLGIGGAYKGGSLVKFALTEAMLQGGVNMGIEASIMASNKDLFERAGIEPDIATNLFLAGAGGAALSGPFSLIGAKVDQASVNRTVSQLAEGLGVDTVDDAALTRLQSLRKSGYRFDARQEHILAQGLNLKKMADRNLKGRPAAEGKALAQGVDIVERSAYEDVPFTSPRQSTDNLRGALRYEESGPITTRLRELERKVDERRKIEVRDRPSKPMKRLLRELDEVKRTAGEARKLYETANRRADNARLEAADAEQALTLAHNRWRAAMKQDSDQVRYRREQLARAQEKLNKEQARRTPSARRIKSLRQAMEARSKELDEASDMLKRRREEFNKAQQRAREAGQRKQQAEADLRDTMDDPDVIDVMNKRSVGFKFKPLQKADKGDVPRRPELGGTTRPTNKPYKGERPTPRESQPRDVVDDAELDELQRRYDETAERLEAKGDTEAAEVAEAVRSGQRMIDGLEAALSCNRGDA